MKVLHVLDISLPTLAGYTSRSHYIVQNQRALGIEPVVVTSVRQLNPNHAQMEEFDGIRHYRSTRGTPGAMFGMSEMFGTLFERPVLREGLEINDLRKRIVEVALEERPDIIHAHSSILCGIPGFLAARQLGLPFVYEIRAFWEDAAVDAARTTPGSPRYVATQQAETLLAKQADALVGICEGIKTELIRRGVRGEDIHTVPNGVETDRFQPIERDASIAKRFGFEGKTVVGYIGTFARFEGVPLLVQALVELLKHKKRDDIRGLIVGEGTTYEACRKIATDAGLGEKIVHPGKVPHNEVKALYSVVDVLAYPRLRERITELVTPLKPLEAMSMEKSVVASDVGGLKELVEDQKTGLLHQAERVEDLAAKIERLADDPGLRKRLGQAGRAYVIEKRQWRRMIENHFAVYDTAQRNWAKSASLHRGMARVLSELRRFGIPSL